MWRIVLYTAMYPDTGASFLPNSITSWSMLLSVTPAGAGAVAAWLVSGGSAAWLLALLSLALMAIVQGVTASAYRAVGAKGRYAAFHFVSAGVVAAMVEIGRAHV